MSGPLLITRGPLLNFSGGGFWAPHPIDLELVWYPTNEHYFQIGKVLCVKQGQNAREEAREVMQSDKPAVAKEAGRSMTIYSNAWDEIAPRRMLEGLLYKFTQNPPAKHELALTEQRELVEHRRDPIWGDNLDGTGRNLMGLALMLVRGKLC